LTKADPLRFVLGMAQMFGAVAGITLLLMTGPGATTLVVLAITTALSIMSRVLYRHGRTNRSRQQAL
jgi:hypothetical protein